MRMRMQTSGCRRLSGGAQLLSTMSWRLQPLLPVLPTIDQGRQLCRCGVVCTLLLLSPLLCHIMRAGPAYAASNRSFRVALAMHYENILPSCSSSVCRDPISILSSPHALLSSYR